MSTSRGRSACAVLRTLVLALKSEALLRVSGYANHSGAAPDYTLTGRRVVPSAGVGIRDGARAGWCRIGCQKKLFYSFTPFVALRRISRIGEKCEGSAVCAALGTHQHRVAGRGTTIWYGMQVKRAITGLIRYLRAKPSCVGTGTRL